MSYNFSVNDYILDQKLEGHRKGGRNNKFKIFNTRDAGEWLKLKSDGEARFCGYLHLKKSLEEANASTFQAAENKMTIHKGKKIIYLSKYCGEEKVRCHPINELLDAAGYTDTSANANMRLIDKKIFVFDTEKVSFDPKVHEKIDSYLGQHDAIKRSLEKQLAALKTTPCEEEDNANGAH